jgi:hypothetical protein
VQARILGFIGINGRLEHRLRPGFPEPLAPPRHARGMDRQLVLKNLYPAKMLSVGIVYPLGQYDIETKIIPMVQIVQIDHQPRAQPRRPTARIVCLPQLFVEHRPVYLLCQIQQRVARINKPGLLDGKQFSLRLVQKKDAN